jgi:hypothetical protein
MTYTIAVGTELGTVQNETLSWDDIVERMTQHEVASTKGGRYFVGGAFNATERKEANLLNRSLLTLDLDNVDGLKINDIEFMLMMNIDCAFVAYSTFSHQPDQPKIRIVVPLSRCVSPDEYREVSRDFASLLPDLTFDPCSFKPNQLMFLPACPDLAVAWSVSMGSEPYDVHTTIIATPTKPELDDFERAVRNQSLDLSDDKVDAYLDAYPAQGLQYDEWIMVGAALHHQFQGDVANGFNRWVDWSAKSDKHDDKFMKTKWRSFGNSNRVVTFASVIHHVRLAGGDIVAAKVVPKSAFKFVRVGDLEYRAPTWLIEGLLETETLGLLFGDPGCGKSFFAVDIALAIATGTPFHNRGVIQGSVFYIAGEAFNGLTRRFQAWSKHKRVDIAAAPLFVSNRPAQFLDATSAAEVTEAVGELASQHGDPVLIVVDTVARNFGAGDENSTSEMGAFIASIDSLKAEFPGSSIMLVHHTGHSDKQRARGSIALKGALDTEYRLDKVGDVLTLTNTKMKDAEPPAAIAFNLENVDLGDEVTSAALVETEMSRKATPLTPNQKLAIEAYQVAAAQEWNGEGEFAGLGLEAWREVFYARHTGENNDTKRKAFNRVRADLVKLDRMTVENDIYQLTGVAEMLLIKHRIDQNPPSWTHPSQLDQLGDPNLPF